MKSPDNSRHQEEPEPHLAHPVCEICTNYHPHFWVPHSTIRVIFTIPRERIQNENVGKGTFPPREWRTKDTGAWRVLRGLSLPHTPKYNTTSQYELGSSKGSFERVFPESVRSDRDQGDTWGTEWGVFCMCHTRLAPSSQLLSGTMMPICHFGIREQCLQLHSPRSRWSSHLFLPLLSPLPSPGPTQSKGLSKSQHRLPAPSPSKVEGP